ncbi:hypothetical protein [Microvirga guangxiensis]|uniref:MFS transporter n=1 Tax=Microvirga guangxiensis TaxID=549386 RepID=A0A1G5KMD0_9HYPH|nr:hypothetical protein [Microvirga guangxiensis]SCZ01089.1 hypothetical protein SAMN02927923_03405 [Microvirga guangxiensis]
MAQLRKTRDAALTGEKLAWDAVSAMTFDVFVLAAAEFLSASLLKPVATDLGITA